MRCQFVLDFEAGVCQSLVCVKGAPVQKPQVSGEPAFDKINALLGAITNILDIILPLTAMPTLSTRRL